MLLTLAASARAMTSGPLIVTVASRMKQPYPIDLTLHQCPQRDRSKIKIDPGVQPGGGQQVRDEGAGPLSLSHQQCLQVLALIMIS